MAVALHSLLPAQYSGELLQVDLSTGNRTPVALLNRPMSVAVDSFGNAFIACADGSLWRRGADGSQPVALGVPSRGGQEARISTAVIAVNKLLLLAKSVSRPERLCAGQLRNGRAAGRQTD